MGMVPGPRTEVEIGASGPNVARVYSYLLGGDNYTDADKEVGDRITHPVTGWPGVRDMAKQNREFIGSAVTWLASKLGIGQFVDAGSGLPPPPPYMPVHVAARAHVPDATVVYVDTDPFVVSFVDALQAAEVGIAATRGDLRHPERVLNSAVVRNCIDFSEPVAIILGATLHYLSAERARRVVAEFMEPLPPGSAAVISCTRIEDETLRSRLAGGYTAASWWNHLPEEVAGWFAAAGLTVIGETGKPGDVCRWPLAGPLLREAYILGGVGVKED